MWGGQNTHARAREISRRRDAKGARVASKFRARACLYFARPTIAIAKIRDYSQSIVLVMTDNLPRGRWPLARVTHVVRGDDGRVRSAEIKTKAGVYVHPVKKLCLLEEVSDS